MQITDTCLFAYFDAIGFCQAAFSKFVGDVKISAPAFAVIAVGELVFLIEKIIQPTR